MQSVIKKIASRWGEAEIIPESDKDVYEYGLELLICSALNIIVILTSSVIVDKLLESLAMLLVTIPLQSCGGGYHAKTHLRCFLIMYTGWWIMIFLLPYIMSFTAIILALLSIIVVIWLAPIPHANVTMSDIQRRKMRRFAIIIAGVAAFMSIVMICTISEHIGIAMAASLGISALSMLAAHWKCLKET